MKAWLKRHKRIVKMIAALLSLIAVAGVALLTVHGLELTEAAVLFMLLFLIAMGGAHEL